MENSEVVRPCLQIQVLLDNNDGNFISVFSEKILIPLEKSFGKHFKQDKMVAIKPEEKKVVLSSADEISYDFLIIATGTKELPPMKLGARNTNEALDLYKKESEKVGFSLFIA